MIVEGRCCLFDTGVVWGADNRSERRGFFESFSSLAPPYVTVVSPIAHLVRHEDICNAPDLASIDPSSRVEPSAQAEVSLAIQTLKLCAQSDPNTTATATVFFRNIGIQKLEKAMTLMPEDSELE